MLIPSLLLKKLYTLGSLKNTPAGVEFAIKNRLSDAELVGLVRIAVDGRDVPLSGLRLTMEDGRVLTASQITPAQPLGFPLRAVVSVRADIPALADGKHTLAIAFESRPFGKLQFSVEDAISEAVRGAACASRARRRRLCAGDHRGAAGVRRADHRGQAATHPALLVRPARGEGQLRTFHRRRAGAAGVRRTVPRQRRARPGRFPDPAGHGRRAPWSRRTTAA